MARKQELPKSWSKWRDDKRSLCQMKLKKVALLLAVDGKSYWEAMILAITNDKFCSLRANFMQELFEQFQGKFYSISTWKWFSYTNKIFIYGQEPYQELLRIFKELKSSDVWNTLQDHCLIVICIKRNIMQERGN